MLSGVKRIDMPFDNDAIFNEENLDRYARRVKPDKKSKSRLGGLGPSTMSPEILSLIGAITDSAGTYKMLKSGTGVEGNPLYSSLNNDPLKTSLAVAGTSLGIGGIASLIGKKYPKLANAIKSNMGASQLALGSSNFARSANSKSADEDWRDTLSHYRRNR